MSARRIAAIALSGAIVAGGAGAAIATVAKDEDIAEHEQAILDDAARRLDVTPEKLREALGAAQDSRLEEAVRNGDITRKQADAISKRRSQSGRVLGVGPFGGRPGGPHLLHGVGPGGGPLHAPGGDVHATIAKALGISRAQLHERLREGTSIGSIAKAEGKSLDDVRRAVKAAAKARLDKAVKDGDIARKQAAAMLEHLDMRLEHLDKRLPLRRAGRWHGHHGRPAAPPVLPGHVRPGVFVPGEDAPLELAPSEDGATSPVD